MVQLGGWPSYRRRGAGVCIANPTAAPRRESLVSAFVAARLKPCPDEAAELDRYRNRIGGNMARYGKAAAKTVKSAMRRRKRGTLKSGKGGKGGRVTSRKQAIAIGLSEARKKGAKVPRKKSS